MLEWCLDVRDVMIACCNPNGPKEVNERMTIIQWNRLCSPRCPTRSNKESHLYFGNALSLNSDISVEALPNCFTYNLI